MAIQYVIVFILIAAAAAYAGYRVYQVLRQSGNERPACVGCPLLDNCKKKNVVKNTKTACKEKKQVKNFAQ